MTGNSYKGVTLERDKHDNEKSNCHQGANDRFPNDSEKQNQDENKKFIARIKWADLSGLAFVHLGCIYGLYLLILSRSIQTYAWLFFSIYSSGFGITAGVHRLWSHRAYKANYLLRVILLILFTISGQRDIYTWALDHRVHHKYTETDADPHNIKRGFMFSHIGWIVLTPHPKVVEKRIQVDMSDLESDSLVMWQKKYYILLFFVFAVALPVLLPCYLWNEALWTSFWINFNVRYCVTLNIAFCVNSIAHLWGHRPYDRNIHSTDNLSVSIAALGEGWHNYHHVFPYDYKTGELGDYTFNLTTGLIDFFARIGWAWDLKTVSREMVAKRKERTGDGLADKCKLQND
ncbi:hypothetical protein RUM43_003698 [Polyplax serrata]|uniref:Fatty acid desaturase domain-containing protein n=1 Tax=Polyplax serrata TaxID=468196 RepID=A0AAN8PPP4_POLSC